VSRDREMRVLGLFCYLQIKFYDASYITSLKNVFFQKSSSLKAGKKEF
jgi:hypothetical protein